MKSYFFLFVLAVLSGCSSQDEDVKPVNKSKQTDPVMQQYYNDFLLHAAAYNVQIKETVVLQFGTCDCQKDGVWQVPSSADDAFLEFYVYHVLGHALLGKQDVTDASSIMNKNFVTQWSTKKEALLDALFK